MFTGLIEKISTVEKVTLTSDGAQIFFKCDFDDVKIGDSIAVNGVCLTVTSIENNIFCADIMKETLNITNLKNLISPTNHLQTKNFNKLYKLLLEN